MFEFLRAHRDIFPGFFLLDLETNVRPKLAALQNHGFYTRAEREFAEVDSCGAHSPRVKPSTSVGVHAR